jgi:hypothetical protein
MRPNPLIATRTAIQLLPKRFDNSIFGAYFTVYLPGFCPFSSP